MSFERIAVHNVPASSLILAVLAILATPALAQKKAPDWLPRSFYSPEGQFVREGTWGEGRAVVRNETNEQVDVSLDVSFKLAPYTQFSKLVWLPPRTEHMVSIPLRPQALEEERTADLQALVVDDDRHPPQIGRKPGKLRVETVRPTTAMLQGAGDKPAIGAVTAMRRALNKTRQINYERDYNLPRNQLGWEIFDGLVVSKYRPIFDAAQLEAMRQWLISGGHLWVLVDQVDTGFMRHLLGEDWTVAIVDEVELNQFQIRGETRGKIDRMQEVEKPIKMVRLYAPGWQVSHTVRGWPASLHKRVGHGLVLLTTVGPRAWYKVEQRREGRRRYKFEAASGSLRTLASMFLKQRPAAKVRPKDLAEYTSSQIGYATMRRSGVAWILGLFTLGFAGFGFVMFFRGSLEHTSWMGVAMAVVAAGFLVAVGSEHQAKVPLTLSESQLAQVFPAQRHAVVHGGIAIYSPDAEEAPLMGSMGGMGWPEVAYDASELVTLRWSDGNRWQWIGLKSRPGAVVTAETRNVIAFDQPAGVALSFGPQGVVGHIQPGPFTKFEDPILIARNGWYVPNVDPDLSLTATPQDQLREGSYFLGNVSTVQQRRQTLYERVLGGEERRGQVRGAIKAPALLAWADPIDLGISLPQEEYDHPQSMLMTMPWHLVETPVGEHVIVPSGFIGFTLVSGPTGTGKKTLWDSMRGEWIDSGPGATLVFRFQLPPSVLPLKIGRCEWTIHVRAPDRSVETFYFREAQKIELEQKSRPTEPWKITLDGPIEHDEDGGVFLGMKVSDPPSAASETQWSIRRVGLQVSGVVGARVYGKPATVSQLIGDER